MLTKKLITRIKTVLDSDLTAYRIAKEVGYASANPIHKLKSGESKIENMQLGTVLEFEKLYEEMKKMVVIKVVKTKKFEHIVGEEWEREYVVGSNLDFIDELEVEFVDESDIEAIERWESGEYYLDNGDFVYTVTVKSKGENGVWEFDGYKVYDENEVLRFENNEGETLGYVSAHDNWSELVTDLNQGADPIADGWEDGLGNTVNMNGWDNVE